MNNKLKKLQDDLNKAVEAKDNQKISDISKKIGETEAELSSQREIRSVTKKLISAKKMLEETEDEEMQAMAEEEVDELSKQLNELRGIGKEASANSAIIEIRAGTGGEEAALFASDLYRMYTKYAETNGWKVELMDASQTTLRGFKTVIFKIEGQKAYTLLKTESGVHRVQRIPTTEASGRIHTSTATVAVLPAQAPKEMNIKPQDIQIDVFRASGPGGQGVNTTDSAVRVTHTPTGIVVKTQKSRSQIKNRELALEILKAKLYEEEQRKIREEQGEIRKSQIGTGERSEKIRTYNFPQDRVTDHRIKKSWHGMEKILNGEIDTIISALKEAENT